MLHCGERAADKGARKSVVVELPKRTKIYLTFGQLEYATLHRTESHVACGIHGTAGDKCRCDEQVAGEEERIRGRGGSRTRQRTVCKPNRRACGRLQSNGGCWSRSVWFLEVVLRLTNHYPVHGEVLEQWPNMFRILDHFRESVQSNTFTTSATPNRSGKSSATRRQ